MERKLATVLFADLVGSTELVSDQDPEITRRNVTAFFDAVAGCIETHGGTVEKFAGDAVMAAFGIPQAHEDDAERAVRAALGIIQNVREGEPLWRSLETTGVVGDLAVEMIKVGESTGALTEMLGNVSEFYDEEIEARLARMVAAIEPLILVFMGLVIAVLLYAFYLPLFQLSSVGQS